MNGEKQLPLQTAPELQFMKEECLACENFKLCNGCYKTIHDHKKNNMVDKSCQEMKAFREKYNQEMNYEQYHTVS